MKLAFYDCNNRWFKNQHQDYTGELLLARFLQCEILFDGINILDYDLSSTWSCITNGGLTRINSYANFIARNMVDKELRYKYTDYRNFEKKFINFSPRNVADYQDLLYVFGQISSSKKPHIFKEFHNASVFKIDNLYTKIMIEDDFREEMKTSTSPFDVTCWHPKIEHSASGFHDYVFTVRDFLNAKKNISGQWLIGVEEDKACVEIIRTLEV